MYGSSSTHASIQFTAAGVFRLQCGPSTALPFLLTPVSPAPPCLNSINRYTDTYMKSPNEMKAAMLAAMIQLDYMFFEDDRPPVDCVEAKDGKSCIM